jgi:tRNA (mo5U34)-methyltransferase
MIDVKSLSEQLKQFVEFRELADPLVEQLQKRLAQFAHGDMNKWREALEALPDVKPSIIELKADTVKIGTSQDADETTRGQIEPLLHRFHPWRKGPFELFGVHIDSEWRSDWKWRRVAPYLQSLKQRLILDVGCGNGYYAWRMLGEGARYVMGIDPTQAYVMQFLVMQKYIQADNVQVLPLAMDDLPQDMAVFDTVFSMGVLYHRRSPLDHILALKDCLRRGGELVLETLVVDGDERAVLLPPDRYAQMRNVWFLPSCAALTQWMQRCGFEDVRCVDISKTTIEEQRTTPWMRFQSLADFLDPDDPNFTREGLPAPVRATMLATKP